MFEIYFNHGDVCILHSLHSARRAWDALALHFEMQSARP
jgi:hypothetical protein